jgi:uncharacterized protein
MRTSSPLVLDVRELLEHPGTQRRIEFDAAVPDLGSGLSSVPGDVHFDLTLEAIDGGVLVRGDLSGTYTSECRRCLKGVSQPFTLSGRELYRPSTDVWEEGYVVKETSIDLEPMARDTVGLGLPTSPLCRDDCKGLCTRCGADLNEGTCDCAAEPEGDLRWSALRELGRDLGS